MEENLQGNSEEKMTRRGAYRRDDGGEAKDGKSN